MRLYALGDSGRHEAGKERVLGIILKIAAAADVAVDVQRRGQPEVDVEALHLIPHDVAAEARKVQVPALGDGGADGDGRAVLMQDLGTRRCARPEEFQDPGDRLRQQLVHPAGNPAVQADGLSVAKGIIPAEAQAGRTVGHDEGRQAEIPGDGRGLARRTGHRDAGIADHGGDAALRVVGAEAQADQAVDVHPLGQRVNFLLCRLRKGKLRNGRRVRRQDGHIRREHVNGLELRPPVGKVGDAADVLCPAGDDLFLQADPRRDDRVGDAVREAQEVIALLQHPAFPLAVIGGDVGQREAKTQALFLPGGKLVCFGKGGEVTEGLVQLFLGL